MNNLTLKCHEHGKYCGHSFKVCPGCAEEVCSEKIQRLEAKNKVLEDEIKRAKKKKLHYLTDQSGTSFGWKEYEGFDEALNKCKKIDKKRRT